MRVANMKGCVDDDKALRLEERCKYLEQLHHDKQKAENLLLSQISSIEDQMRRLNAVSHNDFQEFEKLVL